MIAGTRARVTEATRPDDKIMSDYLPAIELQNTEHPDFAVIWLHGLGADGGDFAGIPPELGLPESAAVRFIFPHAPMIPVTCNAGYVMRAWYDILSIDGIDRVTDEAGIRASVAAIRRLIARENERGVATARIVLAGFSQGGAMAYTAGLTHPEALAGIIALSAYMPAQSLVDKERSAANRKTPIFAAHGSQDEVVPPQLGLAARDALRADGYAIEWHDYPIPHAVCIEEIQAVGAWLAARLAG